MNWQLIALVVKSIGQFLAFLLECFFVFIGIGLIIGMVSGDNVQFVMGFTEEEFRIVTFTMIGLLIIKTSFSTLKSG